MADVEDRLALRVLRRHLEDPVERPVCHYHVEVGVEDHERLAHRRDDGLRLVSRLLRLIQAALEGVDVDERDHRAVDLVVRGPVRPDSHRVPAAVSPLHLAFLDGQGLDHFSEERLQTWDLDAQSEVTNRSTNIARGYGEDPLGHRRQPTDTKIERDHDDGDMGAREEIGEVVADLGQLDVPAVQLVVHRGQLFVGGL